MMKRCMIVAMVYDDGDSGVIMALYNDGGDV